MGFSDLLLQTEKDAEKIKFLSAIKSGGETLLTIIEEVAVTLSNDLKFPDKAATQTTAEIYKLHSQNSLDNTSEALIMIVDDMIDNVVFLEKILQKSGFRTISALNGDSALDLLTEHTPDLILLDIVMPGMTGFETCARIQNNKDFIDIPVIFLSAKKDEKTIIESFIYGGIDYVVKPFNSPELLARVNTHLQLKNAKEKLHTLAFTDVMTGLYNRRKFIESLDNERARAFRYSESLSFIMIDIDHFKRINDSLGHDVGDKALVRFAEIIKSSLRETDFAGRLGGEEFGIILPRTGLEQACVVAERIRARVEEESESKEDNIPHFTASFGVAQFHEDKNSSSLLTQDADKALYEAKGTGRNRICRAGRQEK
jgi:diguanylate cyclase (GGDEF)-like protein